MKRQGRWTIAAVIGALALRGALSGAEPQPPAAVPDLGSLFTPPQPLCDQDGNAIVTRRAVGHPTVADFNGDGTNDVLLGCHQNMDTATAEILVIESIGATPPRFRWPASRVRIESSVPAAADEPAGICYATSCGCKSSGTFETHVVDWNGDGFFDLVVDTYWTDGVRLLLNTGRSRRDPTFVKADMLHRIGSHGMGSGGGDWNNDGVEDFVFSVNHYGWTMYPGVRDEKGGVWFSDKAAFDAGKVKLTGQSGWFSHTPYAWNFSGAHGAGSPVTEIVAVMDDPADDQRGFDQHACRINYYWWDREAGTCALKGTLATNNAAYTRMGIGDLNGDGCMDLLFTGGVFTKGDDTQIRVMYGKVRNVVAAKTSRP